MENREDLICFLFDSLNVTVSPRNPVDAISCNEGRPENKWNQYGHSIYSSYPNITNVNLEKYCFKMVFWLTCFQPERYIRPQTWVLQPGPSWVSTEISSRLCAIIFILGRPSSYSISFYHILSCILYHSIMQYAPLQGNQTWAKRFFFCQCLQLASLLSQIFLFHFSFLFFSLLILDHVVFVYQVLCRLI